METVIIPTSKAEHLAESLEKKTRNFVFLFPGKNKDGKRIFPDGEIYVRIPETSQFKNKKVIVLLLRLNSAMAELRRSRSNVGEMANFCFFGI